jgi:hypothetical protein
MTKAHSSDGVLEVFEVFKIPRGGTWSTRIAINLFEDEQEAKQCAVANEAKVGKRYAVCLNGNWFLLASRFSVNVHLKKGGFGLELRKRQRELSDKADALLNLVLLKEHKDEHGKDESYRILQPKSWEQAFRLVGKEYKPVE